MKGKKQKRDCWLTIRLTPEEESRLYALLSKTIYKSLSAYARALLLEKPVVITYRNRSADDFLFHMLALKAELNAIGNNFNQVVHRLHLLQHYEEIKPWLLSNEKAQRAFLLKTEEIFEKVHEIHKKWLEK